MKNASRAIFLVVVCLCLTACPPPQNRFGSSAGGSLESKSTKKRLAAETYTRLGVGYMRSGKLAIALEKLEQALNLDPRSSNAHNTIAVLYDRLSETALAEKHFAKAVSLDAKNSSAHNNYGGFLCRKKDFKGAQEQYLAAVQNPLYNNAALAYSNAGNCMLESQDKLSEAENLFAKALQRNPRYAPALYKMAYINFRRKRFDIAHNYIQRLEETGVGHSAPSLWLAYRNACQLEDRNSKASYSLLLQRKYPDSDETRLLLDLQERYGNGCP